MIRPHSPMATLCLPLALLLAGSLGCIKGDDSDSVLYAVDGGSRSILAWNKVDDVYGASGTVPSADRTIQISGLTGGSVKLAWGGLAVDSTRDRLYLVTETGTIYSVANASTVNGTISATADVKTLTLGASTDRLANAAFGQACIDQSGNNLYVQETSYDGSSTRVWRVTTVSAQANQYVVPVGQTSTVSGDTYGVGLAVAPGGSTFGLFGGGSTIYDSSLNTYSGPRIRLGSSGVFGDANYGTSGVLIGANTQLSGTPGYGSLAYDASNSALYVLAQNSAALLVFNRGQLLSGGFNQAPARTLDITGLGSLRVLAHPPSSDWLLGANYSVAPSSTSTGTGASTLVIWKDPSGGGTPVTQTLTGTSEIRAMALGGTN